VIYVDTSVVLAHLLGEDRRPSPTLWRETLVASRVLEYEAWTRIHARGLTASHSELLRALLARLGFLELSPPVLARALEPFPLPVRTLDALHLASMDFLRERHQQVTLAAYDVRLVDAARRIGIAALEP
jgi:predicted nucleic acid-binding protein